MYPKASEFLKPIHVFGKLCGVFPVDSLCNDSVSRTYYIFCVALLVSTLHPLYAMFMYQYVRYNDIVCFTVTLHVICILFSNVVNIFVPIQCRRTYVKLFKKLDYVLDQVYTLNMKQRVQVKSFNAFRYFWHYWYKLASLLSYISIQCRKLLCLVLCCII